MASHLLATPAPRTTLWEDLSVHRTACALVNCRGLSTEPIRLRILGSGLDLNSLSLVNNDCKKQTDCIKFVFSLRAEFHLLTVMQKNISKAERGRGNAVLPQCGLRGHVKVPQQ